MVKDERFLVVHSGTYTEKLIFLSIFLEAAPIEFSWIFCETVNLPVFLFNAKMSLSICCVLHVWGGEVNERKLAYAYIIN